MADAGPGGRLPGRDLSGAPVAPLPPGLYPPRTELAGRWARVEPIDLRRHAAELFAAGHVGPGIERLWDYLAYGPWPSEAAFAAWLRDGAAAADPVFFAIRDAATGRASGMAGYLNIRPKDGVIALGHIWLAPALQRTRAATEALYLLMAHALGDLGYRRLEWKCNALNAASRAAALRLGFAFEGIFYRHVIVKGRNRDTAWFSLLAEEWPAVRANFARWLDPANFDQQGRQRLSLGALNRALREA